GTVTKKSSSRVRPLAASWKSRNPPPPGPVSGLSHTQATAAAATAASTAFPPARSTSAPAPAVSGCPAAIAPCIPRAYCGLVLDLAHELGERLAVRAARPLLGAAAP